MMHSAVYTGSVEHRRYFPVKHQFRYRLFMMYLDLIELPVVFKGTPFWSVKHPSCAWFKRSDYHGDSSQSLSQAVRETVHQQTGNYYEGPIRMLTHVRTFGHCFNPFTFYYCFDQSGHQPEAVMAEITNTPWHERHCYTVNAQVRGNTIHQQLSKSFHVSPFMDMNIGYDLSFNTPNSHIHVNMVSYSNNDRIFQATLSLKRKSITPGYLNLLLVSYPLMTLRVVAAIYWQALLLKLKRAPFYVHPRKRKLKATETGSRPQHKTLAAKVRLNE